jgi:serine/threonine protein kinase
LVNALLDDNTRPIDPNEGKPNQDRVAGEPALAADDTFVDDEDLEDGTCDPIELLASDFTERQRRGERPSIDEYAERHPFHAERIRKLFPLIVAVEEVKVSGENSSDGRVTTAGRRIGQLGDFRIVREIGRGGMGIVYEAEQQSLRRRVAIKILPPQSLLVARSLPRFQREARTAARLHHTNIVPVFGTGEADGVHYLVMQLIEGRGLDHWTRQNRDSVDGEHETAGEDEAVGQHEESRDSTLLSPRRIAEIGRQIVDAVAYAHREQVLHRDIKPANIILDNQEHVWVADFGMAQCLQDDMTVTQMLGGSLRYMPPERFEGDGDNRSDIYSIGVTLYELAIAGPAFDSEDATHLVARVGRGDIPSLRHVRRDIPRDLETIIMKAMNPEPRLRYESADALLEDLDRFLEGRTIQARRAGVHERCWRWSKRNPLLAAACALAFTAVCVTFVALSIGYSTAANANRRAKTAFQNETTARLKAENTVTLAVDALNEVIEELAPRAVSFDPSVRDPDSEEDPIFSAVVNAPTPQVARVLEKLIPLYGKLAKQAQGREDIARQAANAGAKLGRIHFQLGNYQESADTLRQAIKLLDQIPMKNRDVEWARELAAIGNDLGAVKAAQFSFGDALRAHNEVLKMVESFHELETDDLLRFEFGRAHYYLGKYGQRGRGGFVRRPPGPDQEEPRDRGTGRVGFAGRGGSVARQLTARSSANRQPRPLMSSELILQHIDTAVDVFRAVSESENFRDRAELQLARSLQIRAVIRTRDRADREADGLAALRTLERLVDEHPHEPSYQFELAQALSGPTSMGPRIGGQPGRWRTGEVKLRRALQLLTDLAERYPTVPVYAVAQAEAHYRLSTILRLSNRSIASRQQLREALTITGVLTSRFPDHAAYVALRFRLYRDLVRSYEQDGDRDGVAATIKEIKSELEQLDPSIANRPIIREVARSVLEP